RIAADDHAAALVRHADPQCPPVGSLVNPTPDRAHDVRQVWRWFGGHGVLLSCRSRYQFGWSSRVRAATDGGASSAVGSYIVAKTSRGSRKNSPSDQA